MQVGSLFYWQLLVLKLSMNNYMCAWHDHEYAVSIHGYQVSIGPSCTCRAKSILELLEKNFRIHASVNQEVQ